MGTRIKLFIVGAAITASMALPALAEAAARCKF